MRACGREAEVYHPEQAAQVGSQSVADVVELVVTVEVSQGSWEEWQDDSVHLLPLYLSTAHANR